MNRESALKYDAILFDLDGTLLDTLEDLADAMNAALRALEMPEHPLESYRYFVGRGLRNMVIDVLPPDRRDEKAITRAMEAMREEYAPRWDAKTRPYDGVPELLEALTERSVTMTILSNKPHTFTRKCVARLLSDWPFALVAGARPDLPIKPDPAGALAVAEQIGVPAERFLYLGDTSTDMQTATGAGMFAVGALWGFRTAEELREHGAAVLLRHPTDLLDLL